MNSPAVDRAMKRFHERLSFRRDVERSVWFEAAKMLEEAAYEMAAERDKVTRPEGQEPYNWVIAHLKIHMGKMVERALHRPEAAPITSPPNSLVGEKEQVPRGGVQRSAWQPIETAPINAWHQLWNEDVGGWIGYWPANYDPGDPLPTHWAPYVPPTQAGHSAAQKGHATYRTSEYPPDFTPNHSAAPLNTAVDAGEREELAKAFFDRQGTSHSWDTAPKSWELVQAAYRDADFVLALGYRRARERHGCQMCKDAYQWPVCPRPDCQIRNDGREPLDDTTL